MTMLVCAPPADLTHIGWDGNGYEPATRVGHDGAGPEQPGRQHRDEILGPAGGGATAFVDGEDVGAVAAAALLNPAAHRNTAWTVTGQEALTYKQIARILTAELGRPIRYARPGIIRYLRHARRPLRLPWGMVIVTVAIYTTARLGLAGGLSNTVQLVLGRDPISFADFAHRVEPSRNTGGQSTPGSGLRLRSKPGRAEN